MKLLVFLFFLFSTGLAHANRVELHDGLGPWIEFELSDQTKSFLIALESPHDSLLYVADLIDPTGKIYVRSNYGTLSAMRIPPHLYSIINSQNRITHVTKGLGSALIPNRDTVEELPPGQWKMRLGSVQKIDSLYYTLWESTGQNQKTATFDVFFDQQAIYPNRQIVSEMLAEVKDIFAKYEIEVEFNLALKNFNHQTPYKLDEYIDQRQQGQRQYPVINLMRAYHQYGPKDFQGFAGCLPYFIPRFVDKHCSIGIAFEDDWNMDTRRFIKVIAHEVAHFFGLFHLNDDYYPFGTLQDPISDTDASIERTNIMHKTSDYYDDLLFTPGQVKVMKRHPLLSE